MVIGPLPGPGKTKEEVLTELVGKEEAYLLKMKQQMIELESLIKEHKTTFKRLMS